MGWVTTRRAALPFINVIRILLSCEADTWHSSLAWQLPGCVTLDKSPRAHSKSGGNNSCPTDCTGPAWWLSGKEPACQWTRHRFDPWIRIPGEGNGNPLQYSCLGNPNDRGAWWAIVHGAAKELAMTEWLNNNDWPHRMDAIYKGAFWKLKSTMWLNWTNIEHVPWIRHYENVRHCYYSTNSSSV